MAALTRAGQGNSPGNAPNSPRHSGNGKGRGGQTELLPVFPILIMAKMVWGQTASACSVSAGHRKATTGQSQGNAQGPKDGQGNTSNKKDLSSLQCFQCQGWGHIAWECASPVKSLSQTGGNQGNAAQPPHQQQPIVDIQHSFSDPKPKLTLLKAVWKKG